MIPISRTARKIKPADILNGAVAKFSEPIDDNQAQLNNSYPPSAFYYIQPAITLEPSRYSDYQFIPKRAPKSTTTGLPVQSTSKDDGCNIGSNYLAKILSGVVLEIVRDMKRVGDAGGNYDPSWVDCSAALRDGQMYRTTMRSLLDKPAIQAILFEAIRWPVFGIPTCAADISYPAVAHFIGYLCVFTFDKKDETEDEDVYVCRFKKQIADRATFELQQWLNLDLGPRVIGRTWDPREKKTALTLQGEVMKHLTRMVVEFRNDERTMGDDELVQRYSEVVRANEELWQELM